MERIKRILYNWVLKDLLNSITLSDIVTYNDKTNKAFINYQPITQEELEAIREEAKYLEKTRIWTLLQGTLMEEAKKKIFNSALSFDDIMMGKSMLYNLDIQNKIIQIFKKAK